MTFSAHATHTSAVSGQGTWESTLQGRDLDGDTSTVEAYYDSTLDITWLADANLAANNIFGLTYNSDLGAHPNDNFTGIYANTIGTNGQMNWGAAKHWIDAMNADGGTGYFGFNDWRLPTMIDNHSDGCNFSITGGTDCGYNVQTGTAATMVHSEMASMWMDTLGNLPNFDTGGNTQSGSGLTNTGLFSNLNSSIYWLGLSYAPNPNLAWSFDTLGGRQDENTKFSIAYSWAVRTGDVGTVPIPAAIWLFSSGLLGLVGIARRKKV